MGRGQKNIDVDPYAHLAAAIVRDGVAEYRRVLKKRDWEAIHYHEKWLRSDWVELLTMGMLNPNWFIPRQRERYL